MEKKLTYIVNEDFKVYELKNDISLDKAMNPLFYIDSVFKKTSSGQRLFKYYINKFYDRDHNEITNQEYEIKGIKCVFFSDEFWSEISNTTQKSVVVKAEILDKLGEKLELLFDQKSYVKTDGLRFKELFSYLKLLTLYATHEAVLKIQEQDRKIRRLEDKIQRLNITKSQKI